MKSFDELAKAAYAAYCAKAVAVDEEGPGDYTRPWGEVDAGTKHCWVAAVQKVVAEVAPIH